MNQTFFALLTYGTLAGISQLLIASDSRPTTGVIHELEDNSDYDFLEPRSSESFGSEFSAQQSVSDPLSSEPSSQDSLGGLTRQLRHFTPIVQQSKVCREKPRRKLHPKRQQRSASSSQPSAAASPSSSVGDAPRKRTACSPAPAESTPHLDTAAAPAASKRSKLLVQAAQTTCSQKPSK